MKITATRTYVIHLGFVEPNGIDLPIVTASPNYVVVDDKYADFDSLQELIINGDVTIGEFQKDPSQDVGQVELNEHLLGLYSCEYTNTPGDINGVFGSASIVSGNNEPFDLRAYNYFRFYIDGDINNPVYTIDISVTKGIYTSLSLVNELNGNSDFTEHLVASVSGGNKVQIETRSQGTSSFVVAQPSLLGPLADGNDKLNFPTTAPSVAGIGTASNITATLVGPTGVGVHKAKIVFGVYTADSPSTTLSATPFVQVVKKGTVLSNLYTPNTTLEIEADSDGQIDIEVADPAHTDNPLFLGFDAPTGYNFAIVPSGGGARKQIANT